MSVEGKLSAKIEHLVQQLDLENWVVAQIKTYQDQYPEGIIFEDLLILIINHLNEINRSDLTTNKYPAHLLRIALLNPLDLGRIEFTNLRRYKYQEHNSPLTR
jgi:hypothetical protein